MTTEPNGPTGTSIVQPHDYSDIIPDAEAYDGYAHSTDGATLPRKLYNRKGMTAGGVRISPDVFWDSVYDTVQPRLDCIMVLATRTRAWFKWSNAAKRNDFFCTSKDAITGTLESTGKQRKCGDTCPDTKWYKDEEGKMVVNCTEVRTVLCVDAERYEPFLLRFQKTSTRTLTQYIARHHDGRLKPKGSLKRYNLPLYAHHCTITLELSENGNFAVPVLELGVMSTAEEAAMARETIAAMQPVLEAAAQDRSVDDQDSARAESGDTSFDPDKF